MPRARVGMALVRRAIPRVADDADADALELAVSAANS